MGEHIHNSESEHPHESADPFQHSEVQDTSL